MISGQARRSRVGRRNSAHVCGALVALCISTAALADAQPQPQGHRLVLVQPENSELITRVEGQTRDLGVTLEVATKGWASGNADEAARIASQRGADFVARVRRSAEGGREVRVYAASSRSLRARNVPAHARSNRLTTSAELEAAALVLRGELSALIEAEREAAAAATTPAEATPPVAASGSPSTTSGGARSQQLPSANEATTPARAEPTEPKHAVAADVADRDRQTDEDERVEEADEAEPDEPPSPPLESYTNKRSAWTIRGGVRGSAPTGSKIAFGLVLGGRAQVLPFLEVGLVLGTAVPFELSDSTARIQLWRSFASAEALAVFPFGPRLRALVGIDAGAVLYARRTKRVLEGYESDRAERALSATLGAQGELQWLLTRQFGVALGVGLSYLPQRTRFAYTVEPGKKLGEIAVLSSLEPHATASLFGQFGD